MQAHLSERDVTLGIHNVPNPRRELIPLLLQLSRLQRQLGNLLIPHALLLEQLRRIPLGLLDGPNLLLYDVDLASSRLLLVVGYGISVDSVCSTDAEAGARCMRRSCSEQ